MPRAATTIRITNADGSVSVDFSGCRGYIDGGEQFADDAVRESSMIAADGTPRFQGLVMTLGGANPHRGNLFGVTFDAAVEASKLAALFALSAATKLAGSFMRAYLVDATTNINGQACKGNTDVDFWLVRGRESEGMVEGVKLFLIAI
jgi:hypothetical protein